MPAKTNLKAARATRAAPTPATSAIYDGSTLLGEVIERGRAISARSARGRSLGQFASLTDAIRALREAHATPMNRRGAP
jgi:hypothetical protein